MVDELYERTKQLQLYNEQFQKYYQESRESGVKRDFFEFIKPFSDKVMKLNRDWNHLIKAWLAKSPQKHIHIQQVDNISEQIEQLAIQAFFPETSKSRFINTNRTVGFFLEQVLTVLENKERDA